MTSLLQAVAAWKVEAAREDNERYFYETQDAVAVGSGDKPIVLGRKGSGKTALALYLSGKVSSHVHSLTLSMESLPHDMLESIANAPNRKSLLALLWKYVMYAAVAAEFPSIEGFDVSIAGQIAQHRIPTIDEAISGVKKTKYGKGVGLDLAKIALRADWDVDKQILQWSERTRLLETFVLTGLSASELTFYLLFDQLDRDFATVQNVRDPSHLGGALELLIPAITTCLSDWCEP